VVLRHNDGVPPINFGADKSSTTLAGSGPT
jgi:hypothetical protein